MAQYFGEEIYFNNDVTFYGNVNFQIESNINFDNLNLTTVNVTGISTLGTIKISSGIVTATSGIATYYGDGSNLSVNGSSLSSALSTAIPTGVIVMWSGTIANIPTGWALCNGSNGTPDLRSRFIVGAGTDTANTWSFDTSTGAQTFTNSQSSPNVGATGGEIAHKLTVAELAAHTHTYNKNSDASTDHSGFDTISNNPSFSSQPTGSTGDDKYHENRPPYFALAFIMKT